MKNKNITVVVAMSGGVDSSVAAALLIDKGYNVIGITMKTYDYMEVGGNIENESNCCDMKAVMDAHSIAKKLGIPHYVVNLKDEFNKIVIDNFIKEYLDGRTPNPCVICNKHIKFSLLIERAKEYGAEFIATGHYARIRYDKLSGRYILSRAKDILKDQSYMLWAVSQEGLAKTILPLQNLTKKQVRSLAEKYNLINARKHESYELCFIPDNNYVRFLKERIPELRNNQMAGNIILDGKIVGQHEGYPFYTIGQRRNIGAHKNKMYVTEIDSKKKDIIIGSEKKLYHKTLVAKEINWGKIDTIKGSVRAKAKVRYKDEAEWAEISLEKGNCIRITFEKPKRAITLGQSVVVYDKNDILCGGVIDKVED